MHDNCCRLAEISISIPKVEAECISVRQYCGLNTESMMIKYIIIKF